MKNTNQSRKYTKEWYDSFGVEDTRYYGVFIRHKKENDFILVDPKRCQRIFHIQDDVKENMKAVMAKRVGPLFRPAKKLYSDYNINVMKSDLARIRKEWEKTNKPMINLILSQVCGKDYLPYDDDLAQSGILEPDEAVYNAHMKTIFSHEFAKLERKHLYYSLYAQFFHQMVSQIEALCIKILTQNGFELESFGRNDLYAFKGNKQEKVKNLEGFTEYDKMYAIWSFIKHNSLSTFVKLKKDFPDVLTEDDYIQGELACFHVNFTDELILSILAGVEQFLKEYCRWCLTKMK